MKELLKTARKNVAKTVEACGRKDLAFNALADADPRVVAETRIANIKRARHPSKAMLAEMRAWQEWLASA